MSDNVKIRLVAGAAAIASAAGVIGIGWLSVAYIAAPLFVKSVVAWRELNGGAAVFYLYWSIFGTMMAITAGVALLHLLLRLLPLSHKRKPKGELSQWLSL